MNRDQLNSYFKNSVGAPNLLNYILSSSESTPGMTDRQLAIQFMKNLPFEEWMIDEQKSLLVVASEAKWQTDLVDMIDAKPPTPAYKPELASLLQSFNQIPVMFTFGAQDSMIPVEMRTYAQQFYSTPSVRFITLPGGHSAIFTDKGREAILNWLNSVVK
jgi:pimeloyl-ACP methyl ester carboxylesterase